MITRLNNIKNQIAACEKKYARTPNSVQLLAVSKTHSVEKITAAYHAGQRLFGETQVQEALEKISALAQLPIEWHFIGPIQSNKTRRIAEHFAWVHSIENIKIAKRLNDQRPSSMPPLNICIEVNISNEATKSGVTPDEALPLAQFCLTQPNLRLRGLMCVPAAKTEFIQQREEFHKLAELFHSLQKQLVTLDTLSMGMTADFEAAIAEGATIVRIGTAIFGEREE